MLTLLGTTSGISAALNLILQLDGVPGHLSLDAEEFLSQDTGLVSLHTHFTFSLVFHKATSVPNTVP